MALPEPQPVVLLLHLAGVPDLQQAVTPAVVLVAHVAAAQLAVAFDESETLSAPQRAAEPSPWVAKKSLQIPTVLVHTVLSAVLLAEHSVPTQYFSASPES